jgi:hypothetical protein
MKRSDMRTTWLAGVAALALVAGACAGADNETTTADEPFETAEPMAADQARGHEGATINLTGCLQKADGEFVLTAANQPADSQPTGTTGADVRQQQVRAAWHSYRLTGDDDNLEQYVGSQIRVSGRLAEHSEFKEERVEQRAERRESGATGSAGSTAKREPLDIDADELGEVEVTMVEKIGDACGNQQAKPGQR